MTRDDLIGTQYGNMEVVDAERVSVPSTLLWRLTLRCKSCGHTVTRGLQSAKVSVCQACATSHKYDGQTVNGFYIRATLSTDKFQRTLVRAICPLCGEEFTAPYPTLSTRKSCGCLAATAVENNFAKTLVATAPVAPGGARLRNLKPGRKTNRNSSTGVKGVSAGICGGYRAYITLGGKQIHLGVFASQPEAAAARAAAEAQYFTPLLPPAEVAPPPEGYIPLGDYATRHGKTPEAALYHAKRGHIPSAVQCGSSWFAAPDAEWPHRAN